MIINNHLPTHRSTIQRQAVLEYLQGVCTHPTAERVHRQIKKKLPFTTLATVYRNLHLLAKQGTILQLEISQEYHFDADTSLHQHCFCLHCGKIIDLFQEKISRFALENIKTSEFQPGRVDILFQGLCRRCQNKRVK